MNGYLIPIIVVLFMVAVAGIMELLDRVSKWRYARRMARIETVKGACPYCGHNRWDHYFEQQCPSCKKNVYVLPDIALSCPLCGNPHICFGEWWCEECGVHLWVGTSVSIYNWGSTTPEKAVELNGGRRWGTI